MNTKKLVKQLSKIKLSWKLWLALWTIALLGPISFKLLLKPKQTEASWWNPSWQYRKRVDVTNNESSDLTDFQISFTIDTATLITDGKMQSDCDDIRITDYNGQPLPFWIEENNPGCNNAATRIWTKIPTIPSSNGNIYIYYGNATAEESSEHNGEKVFNFFDTFDGDLSKWEDPSLGSVSISSGVLTWVTGSTGHQHMPVKTTAMSDMTDMMVEARTRYLTGSSGTIYWGVGSRFNSSYNRYAGALFPTSSRCDIRVNTSGGTNGACTTNIDTWYVVGSQAVGTSIAVFQDRTSMASTSNSSYSSGRVNLDAYYGSGTTFEYDWVLARKVTSSDPTTSLATEETTPGPTAEWHFDEGSGTTAYDSAGGNNGTIGGATWLDETRCMSGKCLDFDEAQNDYVAVSSTPTLKNVSNKMTVSAWVFWRGNGSGGDSQQMIVRGGGGFRFGMNDPTGNHRLSFYCAECTTVSWHSSNTPIPENKWQHVVVSIDGTTVKLYQDGVQTGSFTNDGSFGSTSTWYLGAYAPTTYNWNGLVDEVTIYPYALSEDQIKTDYNNGLASSQGAINQTSLSEGLVGYWKMDENSGTSAYDSSGNGLTLTAIDADTENTDADTPPSSAVGKFGNSFNFDGTDDYLTISDNDILDMEMSNFTVSSWIYSDSYPDGTKFIGKGAGTGGWRWTRLGDQLQFEVYNGSSWTYAYSGTGFLTTGEWMHITTVIDRNSKQISFYKNGSLFSTATLDSSLDSISFSNSSSFSIGRDSWGYQYHDGKMDEVRIYNRALSADQVTDLYRYAPGPVGYWKMDEGTGTTSVADSSGNNNSATMTGFTQADWITGKYGKALNLDGSDNFLETSSPISIGQKSFTYEAWYKNPGMSSTTNTAIISNYKTATTPFAMLHIRGTSEPSPGNAFFSLRDSSSNTSVVSSTNAIDDGAWHHITAVRDMVADKIYLYIDGKLDTSATDTTVTSLDSSQNFIFGSGHLNRFMEGSIDEVKIYDYARTPQQIVEDMNAGHPTGGSPVGSQLAYWKFDEGYGTTAHDTVGNYDGTLSTSTPWTKSGKVNSAMEFDGTGNYYVQSDSNIDLDSDQTYSAWFNPQSISSGLSGIVTTHEHSTNSNIGLNQIDSKLSISIGYTDSTREYNTKYSNSILSTNTWTHAALVYKQSENSITLYVNGEYDNSWVLTKTVNFQPKKLLVGQWSNTYLDQYKFNGQIDEVKIYSSALTADQIKTDYNNGLSTGYGVAGPPEASLLDDGAGNDPVAEWNFDENTGTTINDISGNGHTGTFNGAVDWGIGKISGGASMNGSTSYISIADDDQLEFASEATLESWVKFNSINASAYTSIVGRGDNILLTLDSGGNGIVQCWHKSATDTWYSSRSTETVSTGEWVHLACSYDTDGKAYIYINGKEATYASQQTRTGDIKTTGTGDYFIGRYTSYTNGIFDNTKIYDYARTPAQIAYDYNRGAPVAQFRFDECQGVVIHDSADPANGGTRNDGTLTIGATGTQTTVGTCSTSGAWANGASGKFSSAMSFDGTDDVANSDLSITGYTAISYSTWVNTNTAPTSTTYSTITGNGGRSGIYISSLGKAQARCWDTMDHWTTSTTSVNDGSWHHIMATYSQANTLVTLYVDGVQEGQTSCYPIFLTTSYEGTHIAENPHTTADTYYSGLLDDIRIYNYALSADQVKKVMNEGFSTRFGD